MDTLKIIEALEQRAARLNLSMATVCARAKIAQSTITRWKGTKHEPTLRSLRQLDEVLVREEAEAQVRQAQPIEQDRVLSAIA